MMMIKEFHRDAFLNKTSEPLGLVVIFIEALSYCWLGIFAAECSVGSVFLE